MRAELHGDAAGISGDESTADIQYHNLKDGGQNVPTLPTLNPEHDRKRTLRLQQEEMVDELEQESASTITSNEDKVYKRLFKTDADDPDDYEDSHIDDVEEVLPVVKAEGEEKE